MKSDPSSSIWTLYSLVKTLYVTRFGKTLHMGFFQKIEFDAWLISSTIELTRIQVRAVRNEREDPARVEFRC